MTSMNTPGFARLFRVLLLVQLLLTGLALNPTPVAASAVFTSVPADPVSLLPSGPVLGGSQLRCVAGNHVLPLTAPVTGTVSYGYDAVSRLTSATYPNGDGERVSKRVAGSNTSYAWDPAGIGHVLADSNGYQYVWGNGLVSQVTNLNTQRYPLVDGLGSSRVLIGSNGRSIGTQTYDAFGSVRSTSGTTLPFGFAGEQTDPESGLTYLRARYLDPTTGRFLTKDPAPSEWVYGYANDNPVLGTDPTGQAMVACDTDCGSSPVWIDPVPWEGASSTDEAAPSAALTWSKPDSGWQPKYVPPAAPEDPPIHTCADVNPFEKLFCGVINVDPVPNGFCALNPVLVGGQGDFGGRGSGEFNFGSKDILLKRFNDHGHEFDFISPTDYLRAARKLFAGGRGVEIVPRLQSGEWLYYRTRTEEFGILAADRRTILTYYKANAFHWKEQVANAPRE